MRPDLLRDPTLDRESTLAAALVRHDGVRSARAFRFGNSPRSGLRGDSLETVDFTLVKELRHHGADTTRTCAREAYNLLNQTNFNVPGHVFGAADFGVVSSARAPRTVQLGLRFSF